VEDERQRWVWEGRLPAGRFSLVTGWEKLGKSTAMMWVAARLTRGELPGDYFGQPIDVLFISAEDDVKRSLKPRAKAAEADHSRLWYLDPQGPGFAIEAVREVVSGAVLIILDPMSVFIRLSTSNESSEIALRQALAPFSQADGDMTITGIRHLRKSAPGDNPYDSILGSKAWAAAARAIVFFAPNPHHKDEPRGLIYSRATWPLRGQRWATA
jgi:hypothetical protein